MHLRNLFALPFLLTPLLASPAPLPEPEPEPARQPQRFNPVSPSITQSQSPKYFHEPQGSDELSHYDARYFHSLVPYTERQSTLLHLIKSYLTIFREKNVETWIAHGTLLGWWWNGKIMPWDFDLDVQVSAETLTWLGENLNGTIFNYKLTSETGEELDSGEERNYLLDVNPNHVERVRGDGMNVIDARWIDVRNGLYIDITGLSETNPERMPGVWSCKNFHRYKTRDIYPLRETVFEGVKASVPFAFDKILVDEYSPRALTKTMHEGHTWSPEQKEWIKNSNQGNFNNHHSTRAHMPRSLLGDDSPKSGLKNLLRTL